ncbi:MAG: glycoside hydrolase family 57 protein [bacterium]
MEPQSYFCLVLHAHLPYVRNPEQAESLEERWLYEAINESYLPLLQVIESLVEEDLNFKLTISLSPTLISMFLDPCLQNRFILYLDQRIELAEKEVHRNKHHPQLAHLSSQYLQRFLRNKRFFEQKCQRNLVLAFKTFQDLGRVEIIICPATHGYLPLLKMNPSSVRAQIEVAVQYHRDIFDRSVRGIWLPECGYYPGLDNLLRMYNIRFFFLDTHGFQYADPCPRYAVYAPIYCPSGVAAFGRDQRSARQVWSSKHGYPGDPSYREFYRDVGYELDYEYIRPYIHQGLRVDTGIKYHRITGPTESKEIYNYEHALLKVHEHAEDFFQAHAGYSLSLRQRMSRPPLFVAPYDAELFGHWWYEGPEWLRSLIRMCARQSGLLHMITPSEYLEKFPVNQIAQPAASSWGWKGYNEMWLNDANDWIYGPLYKAGQAMESLAVKFSGHNGLIRRALNQASRELLLAQASDWAFIMKAHTMVKYATERVIAHLDKFHHLHQQICHESIDLAYLESLEKADNLFPALDFEVFRADS